MKVLESFLISLGLKVDKKSFEAGENAFSGITKSALQLGAVLASKLAIDKVVGDFKNAGTELDNFNKLTGMSTQNVQMLGQAIKAQGGNAADAFADMTKLQDLMASPITGNTGWFGDVAKLGLDPDVIIGAQDTAEALTNIAKQFETMSPLNQRLAGNALGLSESTVRLLMKGSEEAQKQLDVRGKLGIMTQQQIDDAARLTKASSELDLVFTDIGNTIAGELAPAFADMAEDFVAFYRDNKDLIDSGLKEFFGELADNIELVAIAMALLGGSAALKGLASLRAIVGLGGAGAGAAGAAAAGGASMLTVAGGGVAALLYSSKLNEGEDTELLNNRLKKGGGEAVGATVDFFMQKGWTREQAEGLAANLEQESGFKADAEGDGGQAYGLAQWHPDRQAEFAKKYGKEIRKSTGAEQLEFINHELTRGNEKSAGGKLKMADNAYDAAAIVSREYERPADKEGEADRRGERARSYGVAPPKPDQLFGGEIDSAKSKAQEPAYDEPGALHKVQREAPREHTANSVVQPAAKDSVTTSPGKGPTAAQPAYTDNRQFIIHGADVGKVKQIISEQMSGLTEKTMQDFRSPEK
ncbi:phage tail tip lysozyme [Pseudomonas sp. PS01302]|uniref:phage tail tip lysozyme n=1 Tax=Pseudomonas sp. PS01302 TaxID=2991438 RepID=UPI00249CC409|nr:phage tail tip lysozyme [Pseudomonas sp. PS01302]